LASAAANASSLSCFLFLGFSSASLSSSFLEDRFFLGLESLLSSISSSLAAAAFFFFEAAVAFFTGMTSSSMSDG